jgi:hypothetical protein
MTAYEWTCVCGTSGLGEKAAQEHAKTCHRFGWPWTNPDYLRPGDAA